MESLSAPNPRGSKQEIQCDYLVPVLHIPNAISDVFKASDKDLIEAFDSLKKPRIVGYVYCPHDKVVELQSQHFGKVGAYCWSHFFKMLQHQREAEIVDKIFNWDFGDQYA